MLGELDDTAIDDLLRNEMIGRIGCHDELRVYVVPITYVYDGTAIYGHSRDGLKLRMMRAQPRVCFEVDRMRDLSNWESVIVWGRFEELHGNQARHAMSMLQERLMPFFTGKGSAPMPTGHGPGMQAPPDASVYRITITERTGRFEKT
jgi:uncharacterized protein